MKTWILTATLLAISSSAMAVDYTPYLCDGGNPFPKSGLKNTVIKKSTKVDEDGGIATTYILKNATYHGVPIVRIRYNDFGDSDFNNMVIYFKTLNHLNKVKSKLRITPYSIERTAKMKSYGFGDNKLYLESWNKQGKIVREALDFHDGQNVQKVVDNYMKHLGHEVFGVTISTELLLIAGKWESDGDYFEVDLKQKTISCSFA